MRIANIDDLKLEAFIRMRELGKLVWKTKDGKVIPIKDMTDNHLINTINMLQKQENSYWEAMEVMAFPEDIA